MSHARLARFLRVAFLTAAGILFQVFTHQALGERLPALLADVMLADHTKKTAASDRAIGARGPFDALMRVLG
jgi:hypothetical protein